MEILQYNADNIDVFLEMSDLLHSTKECTIPSDIWLHGKMYFMLVISKGFQDFNLQTSIV